MRFGLLRVSRNLRQFAGFDGESSNYLEYLYYVYRTEPNHLQPSWQKYFSLLEQGKGYDFAPVPRQGVSLTAGLTGTQATSQATELIAKVAQGRRNASAGTAGVEVLRLNELASAFRTYGHLMSGLDPLCLPRRHPFFRNIEGIENKLKPDAFGLTPGDLAKPVPPLGVGGVFDVGATVGEAVEFLRKRYCGPISFEFGHMSAPEQVRFFVDRVESADFLRLSPEEHRACFASICRAVKFEHFCARAFPTLKRFGMDGIEGLLVLLEAMEASARRNGARSIMITMSHRGRLNVLSNFLKKPLEESFAEFRGANWFETSQFRSGDVKYHNGYRIAKDGIDIQMLSNSSHLQFSHPVLVGAVRAKQIFEGDVGHNLTLPLAIHGNSAICGQGMPYEVAQMSKIDGYGIGGTINIVVNNQIGFTASPLEASSSRYPTDIAKVTESPVIHVNSYSIEAVVFAGRLAVEYRQRFGGDVYVNLVGFRRFGHNELDMPKFTNAEMYARVDATPNLMAHYKAYLAETVGLDRAQLDAIEESTGTDFQKALDKSKTIVKTKVPEQNELWHEYTRALGPEGAKGPEAAEIAPATPATGLPRDYLLSLGLRCATIPSSVKLHPSIKKIYDQRRQALEAGSGLDTAIAETLAFASLAEQGFHVRISGQESRRGTFSHRHAHVQCQDTFKYYDTYEGLDVTVYNCYLSELAALGFEYGYSIYSPRTLNVWEAQFGDFVNGAQVIIDAFVTSGETKWNYFSGLVMFLPHGFDGQGPDHSSCRVERFLQMANDDENLAANFAAGDAYARQVNISVVNCSRSSNFFHALRRQMLRDFRKPMICLTGKRLLKLRAAASRLEEFAEGTVFQRYIGDFAYPGAPKGTGEAGAARTPEGSPVCIDREVDTVTLCSGQIYYDLVEHRDANGILHRPIGRVEELCPFPAQAIFDDLKRFPRLRRVVWAQEEHENGGAFYFMRPRLSNLIRRLRETGACPQAETDVVYVGRGPCASTSAGDPAIHNREHAALIGDLFGDPNAKGATA